MNLEKKVLSSSALKWIALITMLIDHIGAAFFVIYTSHYDGTQDFAGADFFYTYILRAIGRTAFPIFCFVLVEGFFYTRSRWKYLIRLTLFAFLSELPFDLAVSGKLLNFSSQNVFWTLAIGFAVVWMIERIRSSEKIDFISKLSYCVTIGLSAMLMAECLQTDYGAFGVLLIFVFYLFRTERAYACIIGYICMIWEFACFPAFICIYFYNGEKGENKYFNETFLKYFFYLFYPVHLLLLYGLRVLVL